METSLTTLLGSWFRLDGGTVTETPKTPVVLSDGGGVNSGAMLIYGVEVLGLKVDQAVFCDVGPVPDPVTGKRKYPGEWDGTYRHLREIVIPFCEKHEIEFVWLDMETYPIRRGKVDECKDGVFGYFAKKGQIPVSGRKRICTRIGKVERFEDWLNDTYPDQEVEVWIGFEDGEQERVAKDPNAGEERPPEPGKATRRNRFPLIEWNLCRCRCESTIRDAGYPVPRKSACMGCCYNSEADWQTLARECPEAFAQIEALEDNKPLTIENGYKLTIQGWSNWQVTPAQYKALKAINDGTALVKRNRPSVRAMLKRQWVTVNEAALEAATAHDGQLFGAKLTHYGQDIIDHITPKDVGKTNVGEIVPGTPVIGVHYLAPRLSEVLGKEIEKKAVPCPVCGAANKATKATGCGYLSDEEANGGAGLVQLRKAA